MYDVRSHDKARTVAPHVILCADGDASVPSHDDLDGMVRVRRYEALPAANQEEPTLPQVPVRHAQPAK